MNFKEVRREGEREDWREGGRDGWRIEGWREGCRIVRGKEGREGESG